MGDDWDDRPVLSILRELDAMTKHVAGVTRVTPEHIAELEQRLTREARATRYDASLLQSAGYWVSSDPSVQWVATPLARDAVYGVRVDADVPPIGDLRPRGPEQWQLEAALVGYPSVINAWLEHQVRAIEARERHWAMCLWGVHL